MYFKKTIIVLIAIFIGTFTQAQVKSPKQILEEAESKIKQISIDEMKKKIDSGQNFILIDVRTEKEYLAGHIKNAVWIPSGKVRFATQKITRDPKVEMILYCRARGQSALSVYALNEIGYENVLNLDGGFQKWVNAGNSVFNMHGEIKVVKFEQKEK